MPEPKDVVNGAGQAGPSEEDDLTLSEVYDDVGGLIRKKYDRYKDHIKKGHWKRFLLEAGSDYLGVTALTGKKGAVNRTLRAGGAGALAVLAAEPDVKDPKAVNDALVKSGDFPVTDGQAVIPTPDNLTPKQQKALEDAKVNPTRLTKAVQQLRQFADGSASGFLRSLTIISRICIIDDEGRQRRLTLGETIETMLAIVGGVNALRIAIQAGKLDDIFNDAAQAGAFYDRFRSELS